MPTGTRNSSSSSSTSNNQTSHTNSTDNSNNRSRSSSSTSQQASTTPNRTSFIQVDVNCQKQTRILSRFKAVDLNTLEKQTDQLNRIFCVMQNSTTNQHFFNRLSVARDNGQCTIGSLIAIVNPDPIENYMRGIPMITSSEQSMLLRPTFHSSIPLQNDLQANETKAFVLHKVELTIRRLLFKDTKCSGMFCDRQNIEYNLLKAACGCFSHKASLNNSVAILTFIYVLSNGFQRIVHKFSSLQFMNMFTK